MDTQEKPRQTEHYLQQSFLQEAPEETFPLAVKRGRSAPKPPVVLIKPSCVSRTRSAERLMTRICLRMGVPMHLRGYSMLYSGVMMAVTEPELVYNLTSGLYARLANKFGCSVACVERDIRNMIALTWERGSPEEAARMIGTCFRPHPGKPTNSELISLLAERLRMENDGV